MTERAAKTTVNVLLTVALTAALLISSWTLSKVVALDKQVAVIESDRQWLEEKIYDMQKRMDEGFKRIEDKLDNK